MTLTNLQAALMAASFSLCVGTAGSAEPSDTTGSRLNSKTANPTVVRLNEPDEIDRVRLLLQEGRGAEAVALARDYLAGLDPAPVPPAAATYRYFALNALCGALTQTGELVEAVATCSRAIALNPQRWSAVNNRGTAHFVAGEYHQALVDYRRALMLAQDNVAIIETIQHNIRLCEAKLAIDG